jgi:hypothetical protein
MQHDGSNSARARSARIRTAHDDEATRLDSMHRRASSVPRQRRSRVALIDRLSSFLLRARVRQAESPLEASTRDEVDAIADSGLPR